MRALTRHPGEALAPEQGQRRLACHSSTHGIRGNPEKPSVRLNPRGFSRLDRKPLPVDSPCPDARKRASDSTGLEHAPQHNGLPRAIRNKGHEPQQPRNCPSARPLMRGQRANRPRSSIQPQKRNALRRELPRWMSPADITLCTRLDRKGHTLCGCRREPSTTGVLREGHGGQAAGGFGNGTGVPGVSSEGKF